MFSPSSFVNSIHSAADASSLTAKISKITKEKHVLNFRLSRQKHTKTHANGMFSRPSPHFLAMPMNSYVSKVMNYPWRLKRPHLISKTENLLGATCACVREHTGHEMSAHKKT